MPDKLLLPAPDLGDKSIAELAREVRSPEKRGALGGRRVGKKRLDLSKIPSRLEYATALAIETCIEIMERAVPKTHRQYVRHKKVQKDAAGIILNTAVRVDDARLRKQLEDRFPSLMKLLAEEERRQKRVIEGEAVEVG